MNRSTFVGARTFSRASGSDPGDQAQGLRSARTGPASYAGVSREGGGPVRKIAVTSGKGGVGKTQIAANVASSLAARGRRVLLLDADLGLASLDLALGVTPISDVLSVVSGERTMREVLVDGPHGLRLVPACPGRYEMANLDARGRTLLCDAIDALAHEHDVVVIDTAAGIGPTSVAFAAHADRVLLVATPDPSSIRDAYAMTKVLERRAGVTGIDLVANNVSCEAEAMEVFENLSCVVRQFLTLELRYLGCVPHDVAVREAVLAGRPLVLRNPESMAARALDGLARRIDPVPDRRAMC